MKKTSKKNSSKQAATLDVLDAQKRVLTVEGVADQLRRWNGNQAAVGRTFGVTRQAVNDFIKHNDELKAVVVECRESFIDNVESSIYSSALGNPKTGVPPNITAQIFILKTLGKRRGWVERNELTGADGKPLFDERERVEAAIAAWMEETGGTRQQAIKYLAPQMPEVVNNHVN